MNDFDFTETRTERISGHNWEITRTRGGPKVSRVGYLILALFLGLLGVHNFYAKRVGRGVSQLILSLFIIPIPLVALWVIVDMISVETDGRGRYMK